MGQAVMIGAAVAGTALQAAGQIGAGEAAAQAAQAERQQLERQAQLERTRAAQEEAARRADLTDTLASIAALRASRGLATSPTGQALVGGVLERAGRDIGIARLSGRLAEDTARMAAAQRGREAHWSRLGGWIGGAGSLLTGGAGLIRLTRRPPGAD